MWWGAAAGLAYAVLGFGPQGTPPRLAVSWGPFERGHLVVAGYHVHHWVVYGVVGPVAFAFGWANVASFAAVMVAQGLSYGDRFRFT